MKISRQKGPESGTTQAKARRCQMPRGMKRTASDLEIREQRYVGVGRGKGSEGANGVGQVKGLSVQVEFGLSFGSDQGLGSGSIYIWCTGALALGSVD
jgi:hypothetical protein